MLPASLPPAVRVCVGLTALGLALLPLPAAAGNLYVDCSGEAAGAYPSIGAALAAAVGRDPVEVPIVVTVFVAPETLIRIWAPVGAAAVAAVLALFLGVAWMTLRRVRVSEAVRPSRGSAVALLRSGR